MSPRPVTRTSCRVGVLSVVDFFFPSRSEVDVDHRLDELQVLGEKIRVSESVSAESSFIAEQLNELRSSSPARVKTTRSEWLFC